MLVDLEEFKPFGLLVQNRLGEVPIRYALTDISDRGVERWTKTRSSLWNQGGGLPIQERTPFT